MTIKIYDLDFKSFLGALNIKFIKNIDFRSYSFVFDKSEFESLSINKPFMFIYKLKYFIADPKNSNTNSNNIVVLGKTVNALESDVTITIKASIQDLYLLQDIIDTHLDNLKRLIVRSTDCKELAEEQFNSFLRITKQLDSQLCRYNKDRLAIQTQNVSDYSVDNKFNCKENK